MYLRGGGGTYHCIPVCLSVMLMIVDWAIGCACITCICNLYVYV